MKSDWNGLRLGETISAHKVDKIPYTPYTVLLLGPIGSGKSNFIETLLHNQSLGISNNQLEGGTTEITAYKLDGVKRAWSNIYLVDVPGLSNPNVSELSIVDGIRKWVEKSVSPVGFGTLGYILYFERITDNRVSGSKSKVGTMFKELLGSKTARSVTIVTTMWDDLQTESQSGRADARFAELKNEHWKDVLDQGANLVKFQNTQESALEILRDVVGHSPNAREYAGFDRGKHIGDTAVAGSLQQSVGELIQTQIHRLHVINEDLTQESTITDTKLHYMLLQEKADIEARLETFQKEYDDCKPLPKSETKSQGFNWFGLGGASKYAVL